MLDLDVNKHYARGAFIISGRKMPRDGGIILAVADDHGAVEATFVTRGLADCRIIELRASQRVDDLPGRIR